MSGSTDPEPLAERLRSALRTAMKAQEPMAITALRTVIGAIDNAAAEGVQGLDTPVSEGPIAGAVDGLGAGEVPRRELSDAEVEAIVRKEIEDRRASAKRFERAGRHGHANELVAEADVLARVLGDP